MKIRVSQQPSSKTVSVGVQPSSQVVSVGIQGPEGPVGIVGISELPDVDATSVTDGSVLVFKSTTHKWTSTTTLDAQYMDGGEF